MLDSVCTYHIDVLLECFDNRTLGMIDKAREGDRQHGNIKQTCREAAELSTYTVPGE